MKGDEVLCLSLFLDERDIPYLLNWAVGEAINVQSNLHFNLSNCPVHGHGEKVLPEIALNIVGSLYADRGDHKDDDRDKI